jgi:hypothetical protein
MSWKLYCESLFDIGFKNICLYDHHANIIHSKKEIDLLKEYPDAFVSYCNAIVKTNLDEFDKLLPLVHKWILKMNEIHESYNIIISFQEFSNIEIGINYLFNVYFNPNIPHGFDFKWNDICIDHIDHVERINQLESFGHIERLFDKHGMYFNISKTPNEFNVEYEEQGISFDDVKESVKNQKVEDILLERFPLDFNYSNIIKY